MSSKRTQTGDTGRYRLGALLGKGPPPDTASPEDPPSAFHLGEGIYNLALVYGQETSRCNCIALGQDWAKGR